VRLAYIVLAHKAPAQVARLVRRVEENALVLVHYDKRSGQREYQQLQQLLTGIPGVVLLRQHPVYWGRFGIITAIFEGIQYLVDNRCAFDMCILLSGQDYPIKSQETIRAFFATRRTSIFLSHSWMQSSSEKWRLDRLHYWYFMPFGISMKFPNRYLDLIVPVRRTLPRGFQLYTGSCWWCIPRDGIEYLYEFAQERPDFFNFFKHAASPEEYVPQMILMNSPLREDVVDDDLHYTEWPLIGGRNSPLVLSMAAAPRLLVSDKLFARKFDIAVDADVLNALDHAAGQVRQQRRVPQQALSPDQGVGSRLIVQSEDLERRI
jgi:Core-2/I-Branching enzyme